MNFQIQPPSGDICWPVSELAGSAHDVRHVTTKKRRAFAGPSLARGTTRWQGSGDEHGQAWFEWEWIEMAEGVVVQADPLGVRSNVLLIDDRGRPVLPLRRSAMLATFTYLLPWQGPVLDRLWGICTDRFARYSFCAPQRLAAALAEIGAPSGAQE